MKKTHPPFKTALPTDDTHGNQAGSVSGKKTEGSLKTHLGPSILTEEQQQAAGDSW
jgi:hypothetical protein